MVTKGAPQFILRLAQVDPDVESYLKSAAEQVDSKMKSKINALEKMVAQIKADLNSKKDAARAGYEKTKSDLRQLIHDF